MPQMSQPCRVCGHETRVVVNIELQRTPVCDRCCLAITKQTVSVLTVKHSADGHGPTTEICSRHLRGEPV